eukprot:4355-Chlamydomonas_euryale.AAC.2
MQNRWASGGVACRGACRGVHRQMVAPRVRPPCGCRLGEWAAAAHLHARLRTPNSQQGMPWMDPQSGHLNGCPMRSP